MWRQLASVVVAVCGVACAGSPERSDHVRQQNGGLEVVCPASLVHDGSLMDAVFDGLKASGAHEIASRDLRGSGEEDVVDVQAGHLAFKLRLGDGVGEFAVWVACLGRSETLTCTVELRHYDGPKDLDHEIRILDELQRRLETFLSE